MVSSLCGADVVDSVSFTAKLATERRAIVYMARALTDYLLKLKIIIDD